MDKITLKNMKFYAYHGVLPEEQARGQYFYIDVEMYVNLDKPCTSDCLEDTVDYSAVYGIIKDITLNNTFQLIEKLAGSISKGILDQYGHIARIVVRVRKPEAPIGGELDWAEVEITRYGNGI
ncbi:MAG: dihydroneopterin aldolase [Clostridiales bacterium]|nr:dihydroneopterin aldolase [Clostridiales bacterium]